MTDREAALRIVVNAYRAATTLSPTVPVDALIAAGWKSPAEVRQAREDGRRDAAQAIWDHIGQLDAVTPQDEVDLFEEAARLARGTQQPGKENPDGQ